MKGKKIIFLFLAFLLPVCVFFFLKIFGRNEFAVQPLFQDVQPEGFSDCDSTLIPFKVKPSQLKQLIDNNDSLSVVFFNSGSENHESENQIKRFKKEVEDYNIRLNVADTTSLLYQNRRCNFLLKDPYDVVLIDHKGIIRGQYVSWDRDEMDRLITEVDIILKKY